MGTRRAGNFAEAQTPLEELRQTDFEILRDPKAE